MSPGRPRDPATGRFISDTRDNSIAIRELNTQLGEAANRFEAMGRSIPTQQINNFDEGLLIGTAALVGLNAALQDVIGSQIDAAVTLERQQVSLQTVTGSVEAAEAQYRRLLEVARLPGINISQALGGSAQLQAIGLSGERAAEAIGAIGNALASSGQSAQQLTPIVSGFRQINAEGKILQEDLAIITTRIPSLIPLMKEAFGGTRAEDVRKFYESIGEADRQTELFSEKLIEMLQTLPQISETAGNALENLEDTAQRLQARIGTHLLPSVKSAATGLEDVLKAIENSEGATRSIAVFSSFAGTMLSIVTAGASVRGALGLLRPLLPALLGGPWGIAIAAVGALAGVFIAWRAATSEAREEIKNLNTFIAQNTELLNANEAAIESGSLAELRASETTIRKARDAAKARVEQLQESAKAQFDELRGIKRSGEAFDELSGSLRSTSANLKNAEAELERLNTTLKETNTEAGNLEKFETNVNNLKTAIEALNKAAQASEGIGRILRGDGVDSRGPQSDLIKVADAIISDLDTYNQIAEAARGGDERAIENLTLLQSSLQDAAQSYLEVLREGFGEAETIAEFQEFKNLAAQFQEAFGNVDFLSDVTSAFEGLEAASQTAQAALAIELSMAQGLGDEYERLNNLTEGRQKEAERALAEFERAQTAAVKEIVREEEEAYRQRSQFTKRQLSETLQALNVLVNQEETSYTTRQQFLFENARITAQVVNRNATVLKDTLKEEEQLTEDGLDRQIQAVERHADDREAAAERVTDRLLDEYDERLKAQEKADRDAERSAKRTERERVRAAEREARALERLGSASIQGLGGLETILDSQRGLDRIANEQFAQGLINESQLSEKLKQNFNRASKELGESFGVEFVDAASEALDLPFLGEGLRAALGDPTAFAKSWAEGFLSGIKDILDGAQLSPFQEEIQGLRLSELDTSQLDQALENNLAQQARLLDGYSETVLQGTVVWESLIASEMALRDQLKAATTSLVDSVAEFAPGFGDQRTPLYNEITQGLVALGLSVEELQPIIGQFADSSLSELRNLNSTIKDRANIDAEQRAEQREEEGRESIADALQSVLPDIADAIDPLDTVPAIRENLEELGLPPDQINAIVTAVEDAPEGVQNAVERLIDAEVKKEAREAEREKKKEDRELKRNASLSSIAALSDDSLDVLRKSVRDAEDTPLENLLDNEQGLLRIFGAEQTAAFLVGSNRLIREQEEFLRQQRRAQDPEFALVDDLELLLRTAEVESAGAISTPEIDALLTTLRKSLALDEGLTSEAAISALKDLRSLLSRANVLAETTDAFTRRFFDEFIQDGLEITVGKIPDEIRVAVDTEGVLLGVDPKAVVGVDTEGKLVAVDPEAEVGLKDDAEASLDPDAEAKLEDGAEVDVDTGGKTLGITPADLLKTLGITVADLAKTLGITPTDLLKTLGITPTDLLKTLDITVADLAKTLGITPTDLLKTLDITPADLLKTLDITVADLAKTLGITPTDLLKTLGITPTDLLKTLGITPTDLLKTLDITVADLAKTLGITPTDLLKTLDITPADLLKTLGITPTDLLKTLDITPADLLKTLGITPADLLKTLDITPADLLKTLTVEDKAFTATLDTGFFLTDLEALWGRLIYQATQPQPQGEAAGTEGGAVEQAGDITRTPPAQTAFVDSFEAFLADTRLLLREAGQGGMVEGSTQLLDALEAVSTRLSEVSASEERRLLDQTSSVFESGNVLPETTEAFISRLDQLILETPQMPVDLSQGSGELIANTIAGKTLTVGPDGGTMEIEGDVSAEVRGKVDVGKPTVIIEGPVTIQGTVELAGGRTIPVRIENTGDLINEIDDARATAPAGDFNDFPAG